MQSEHERFFMNTGLLYVRALSGQLCQQIISESTNPELKTKRLASPTKRNVLLSPTSDRIESFSFSKQASSFFSRSRITKGMVLTEKNEKGRYGNEGKWNYYKTH